MSDSQCVTVHVFYLHVVHSTIGRVAYGWVFELFGVLKVSHCVTKCHSVSRVIGVTHVPLGIASHYACVIDFNSCYYACYD